LVDFPEREYELGLLTTERKAKPLGEAIARIVREAQHAPVDRTPIRLHGDRPSWGPGGAFFEEWMTLARSGVRASIGLG
jgi:hypothetical protein